MDTMPTWNAVHGTAVSHLPRPTSLQRVGVLLVRLPTAQRPLAEAVRRPVVRDYAATAGGGAYASCKVVQQESPAAHDRRKARISWYSKPVGNRHWMPVQELVVLNNV